MDIETRTEELRAWLAQRWPQQQFTVVPRGRQVVIAWVAPEFPGDPARLIRLSYQPSGHWDVSYFRHTGRWEVLPTLGGPWPAIRQVLADDPLGLFWADLKA